VKPADLLSRSADRAEFRGVDSLIRIGEFFWRDLEVAESNLVEPFSQGAECVVSTLSYLSKNGADLGLYLVTGF
jgi:hypothetical protein